MTRREKIAAAVKRTRRVFQYQDLIARDLPPGIEPGLAAEWLIEIHHAEPRDAFYAADPINWGPAANRP